MGSYYELGCGLDSTSEICPQDLDFHTVTCSHCEEPKNRGPLGWSPIDFEAHANARPPAKTDTRASSINLHQAPRNGQAILNDTRFEPPHNTRIQWTVRPDFPPSQTTRRIDRRQTPISSGRAEHSLLHLVCAARYPVSSFPHIYTTYYSTQKTEPASSHRSTAPTCSHKSRPV